MPNKNRYLSLFLLVLILFSCRSNKAPLWVSEPPTDDELNIYIVGIGKDEDVYQSVLKQIYERFNIKEDKYFSESIMSYLLDENNTDILIIDTWSSDTLDYILVRIKRSFFDPLLDLYTTRYDEMMSFANEYEIEGDDFYKRGELYSSYKQYVKALDEMLSYEDNFYSPAILEIIQKIKGILNQINYLDIKVFSDLVINKPVLDNFFSFKISINNTLNFDGFLFNVNFTDGWESKERSAIIPIKANNLKFVPPIPKVSGNSTISSNLVLNELANIVNKWKNHKYLSAPIGVFKSYLESLVSSSALEFDFNITSGLNLFKKVIAFENTFVSEGISRFLIELEDFSILTPIFKEDESLSEYVREVNSITQNLYYYMILGSEVKQDITTFDEEGILIKLSSEFFLVDMNTSNIIQSQKVNSEFLGVEGDEDLAYLDLGLKIGEVIYGMKF